MATRTCFVSVAVLAAALAGLEACGVSRPVPAVDPSLAACLPSDTLAIAGVDLQRLRASPVYRGISSQASAALEPLRGASYLLLSYNGRDILAVARGDFRETPAGAVMLSKDIAASGAPEAVRAASAQRKTGRTGAGWLLNHAADAAQSGAIWAIARGGIRLPLQGDAANVNQLLRRVEYATVALRLDSDVRIEAAAAGSSEEAAREFEDTLRAFFSLATAASRRNPGLAAAVRSAQVRREGLMVHASVTAPPNQAASLLGAVLP